MRDPDLRLVVNGAGYAGWEGIRVTRGIESVCGSFEIALGRTRTADGRWSPTNVKGGRISSIPIAEEDECAVRIGDETVITGYVDRRSATLGPSEHSLTLSGRDRAAALVDCSALPDRWEYLGVSLVTLVQRLAAPFGITVAVQAGLELGKVAKLTVDPGETAWEAIERACRSAAVLAVSDGAGGLRLTRVGSARAVTALVEGQNLETISLERDASGRFSRYVVLAQHQGSESLYGSAAASIRAEARDAAVARAGRVLVVRAEGNASLAQAQARAQWEAKVRAGRAATVTATVTGWCQGDGALWPINALVPVRSPTLGIDGEMLITQAVYAKGDSGTTTTLQLQRPDAFLPEPVVGKKGKGERWGELA